MQLIHKSITVWIQHTYHKIITDKLVAFVNKLSVVASYSEIVVLLCFIRDDKIWFGLVETNWNSFSSPWSIMPTMSKSEAQ